LQEERGVVDEDEVEGEHMGTRGRTFRSSLVGPFHRPLDIASVHAVSEPIQRDPDHTIQLRCHERVELPLDLPRELFRLATPIRRRSQDARKERDGTAGSPSQAASRDVELRPIVCEQECSQRWFRYFHPQHGTLLGAGDGGASAKTEADARSAPLSDYELRARVGPGRRPGQERRADDGVPVGIAEGEDPRLGDAGNTESSLPLDLECLDAAEEAGIS
jgi:hypothetical protein